MFARTPARVFRDGLRSYTRARLLGDASAGLTVAALVLPLSLGLAVTAGLPPEQGLYSSILPLLAFALIASSRRTMIGPDASVTALIVASVVPLAAGESAVVLSNLVAALAIAAGLVCIASAALGAGRLASLLNESSLIGYLAGLAIVVGIAQLPRITQLATESERTLAILYDVITKLASASGWGVLLASGTILLVTVARARTPAFPWLLLAIGLATLVSETAGLPDRGIATIGALPSGLPALGLPDVTIADTLRLLPIALAVACVTFADTMATTSGFAARHHEPVAPGRDLAALGAANVAAGLAGGMPVSASGARTAAAEAAGGSSQVAGAFAAAAVAVVLLGGGEVLSMLPRAALGGVGGAAVIPMVDVQSLARLRRLERGHFVGAIVVTAGVVAIGVLEGIVVAFVVSIIDRVARARSQRPSRRP